MPASVLFRAPLDTITRRAKTFSASLVHFDTVTTCWVSSGQILICGFSVTALVGGKKITIVDHQNWALLHKRWHLTEVKKHIPALLKYQSPERVLHLIGQHFYMYFPDLCLHVLSETRQGYWCVHFTCTPQKWVRQYLVNVRGNLKKHGRDEMDCGDIRLHKIAVYAVHRAMHERAVLHFL